MFKNWKRNTVATLALLLVFPAALTLTSTRSFSTPAANLTIEKVDENSGFLTVTFTAQNLFSPRIVETLARGLPATVSYEIQLWRERRMWFDRLLWANRLSYRVRYDPWEDGFRIETREGSSPAVFDLEHVERSLCFHVKARAGNPQLLKPLTSHYVVVRATVRLLSPEDIDEFESWLSEGSEDQAGGIRAMPRYLFDVIVGLSGFGDEATSGKSRPFRRGESASGISYSSGGRQ